MKYDGWWCVAKFLATQRRIDELHNLFHAVPHLGRSYLSKDKFLADLYAVAAANIKIGDIWYFHIDAFDKWQQLNPLLRILPVKQTVVAVEQSKINFHEWQGFYTPNNVSEITTVYQTKTFHTASSHFVYQDGKFDFFVRRNRNYWTYGVMRNYFDGKTLYQRNKGSGYCYETIYVDQYLRYKMTSGRADCQTRLVEDDSERLDVKKYERIEQFYMQREEDKFKFRVHLDTTKSEMFRDGLCFAKRMDDPGYSIAQKLLPDFYLKKEQCDKYFDREKKEFFDTF